MPNVILQNPDPAVTTVPASDISAQFVNRYNVIVTGDTMRLAFGEWVYGPDTYFHTALVMPTSTAEEFAKLILKIMEQKRLADSNARTANGGH